METAEYVELYKGKHIISRITNFISCIYHYWQWCSIFISHLDTLLIKSFHSWTVFKAKSSNFFDGFFTMLLYNKAVAFHLPYSFPYLHQCLHAISFLCMPSTLCLFISPFTIHSFFLILLRCPWVHSYFNIKNSFLQVHTYYCSIPWQLLLMFTVSLL